MSDDKSNLAARSAIQSSTSAAASLVGPGRNTHTDDSEIHRQMLGTHSPSRERRVPKAPHSRPSMGADSGTVRLALQRRRAQGVRKGAASLLYRRSCKLRCRQRSPHRIQCVMLVKKRVHSTPERGPGSSEFFSVAGSLQRCAQEPLGRDAAHMRTPAGSVLDAKSL
jgi:hypothetical protein